MNFAYDSKFQKFLNKVSQSKFTPVRISQKIKLNYAQKILEIRKIEDSQLLLDEPPLFVFKKNLQGKELARYIHLSECVGQNSREKESLASVKCSPYNDWCITNDKNIVFICYSAGMYHGSANPNSIAYLFDEDDTPHSVNFRIKLCDQDGKYSVSVIAVSCETLPRCSWRKIIFSAISSYVCNTHKLPAKDLTIISDVSWN